MNMQFIPPSLLPGFALTILPLVGCHHAHEDRPDQPRLAAGVRMQDVTFHSAALQRDMPYRVFLPASIDAGKKLPVVYLLHGGNGTFRDWSNYSDVARYAAQGLILVMPEGGPFSYYRNAAQNPQDRYQDYLVNDLISDVETRFPAATDRDNRAIVGISMGGFASVELALTRPELFAFIGAFSPSIEAVHRRFNPFRWGEWVRFRTIFGPCGSESRRALDPFVLVQTADPARTPYIYITSGDNEPLLGPDRRFADRLKEFHFAYEFHTKPGGHDWGEWNSQVPGCFDSLLQHLEQARAKR